MDQVIVVREVTILRSANIHLDPDTPHELVGRLPPPPERKNRCLYGFVVLVIYFVGIGSIVLGALHFNDCPAEKMLPKGLIIFGGMLMVSRLLNCVYDRRSVCEEECSEDTPGYLVFLNVLFYLAEFGMFIALCYYAFSVDPTTKPEDHGLKNYCDYVVYETTFYGCITGLLLIFGLPFLCWCCAGCC